MLKIIKITGESLLPDYEEGDYVIAATLPFLLARLKPGDLIIFRHPVYGTMVKRVERVFPETQEISISGNHPQSTDSRQFGPIPQQWVTGKVLWHIAKPG
jgi:nickel-type superoxide dismutase maturation protease